MERFVHIDGLYGLNHMNIDWFIDLLFFLVVHKFPQINNIELKIIKLNLI